MYKKVSVIIPVYNEEKFIYKSLQSLLNTNYPKDKLEFIIIDGGSCDRTLEEVEKFASTSGIEVKILHNPKKITPISLNLGIKAAQGDIIIRADAHTVYPDNYIDRLIFWKKQLNADNVGGVFIHTTTNDTRINHAIINALETKFGVGGSLYRILRQGDPIEVDTVPFGIFERELFNRIGLYNEKLVRNQDIELNKRILAAGGKIYLIPEIHLHYYPRGTLKEFAQYNFKNGLWNILTVFITKNFKSLSFRHFVPLFFVSGIIGSLLLAIIFPVFWIVFAGILIAYFSVALAVSLKNKNTKTTVFHKVIVFFILHFFYGLGEIWAIITLPMRKF